MDGGWMVENKVHRNEEGVREKVQLNIKNISSKNHNHNENHTQ